jgi:GDP/UDP-N,N'-diacetylbacillosamine 2-epimerase (hydrolysing)
VSRRIIYISGTRADFGLMKQTLLALHQCTDFELVVLATGMHLLEEYGRTVNEIISLGLTVHNCPVTLSGRNGSEMAHAISNQIAQFTDILDDLNPDLLLLLGDRGEMLAGAIAALHLKIPIAHIHGGERSGTIDEPMRHAITKLSHIHFTSTDVSRERIIKMGERPNLVFTTGAPGLDEIYDFTPGNRKTLFEKYGLNLKKSFLMFLFHPVVQQDGEASSQANAILDAVEKMNIQTLVLLPNSDSGGRSIRNEINLRKGNSNFKVIAHLPRSDYLSLLSYASVLVGNSSSGIIESASLGTPAVNIGSRQQGRERNSNTIDVECATDSIYNAIVKAIDLETGNRHNVYGDGTASRKITELLKCLELDSSILQKLNTY